MQTVTYFLLCVRSRHRSVSHCFFLRPCFLMLPFSPPRPSPPFCCHCSAPAVPSFCALHPPNSCHYVPPELPLLSRIPLSVPSLQPSTPPPPWSPFSLFSLVASCCLFIFINHSQLPANTLPSFSSIFNSRLCLGDKKIKNFEDLYQSSKDTLLDTAPVRTKQNCCFS